MPKKNNKARRSSAHDNYELPPEIDFTKQRFIGFGLASLEKEIAAKSKFVALDPDVARVFKSSKSVNAVLRGIIQALPNGSKRRKSA